MSTRPLTECSALELAGAIRDGRGSASEVVGAHIERHQRFAPVINAIVADRYARARDEAASADRVIADAGTEARLPPLLGVPFTVKESIAVRGMPNAAGLVARGNLRSERSAPTVERLTEAGAIPIGVTNTSELTLWIESANKLYGRTNNPYDASRTAGGSSGGEGAAVGSGGSPFGLATDIAGSIRIPAFFCGVFGHKPSRGLVPNTGSYPPSSGDAGLMLGTGPLARRAEDLMPLLRILAGPDGEDPYTQEIELGDPRAVSLHGLDVVTVEDSSRLALSAELRDARERVAGALVASGASVRRVTLRSWRKALLPYLATLQVGGGQTTGDLLVQAGEQLPTVRDLLRRHSPFTVPTRFALAAERFAGEPDQRVQSRLLASARRIADELTQVIGDGVLLHPVQPYVAPRHGRTLGRPWLLTPAAVFNLAGLPVTEVPLGLSENGLPLGIQVAAGLYRDHVSVAVALELERVFGGWIPPTMSA